MRVNRGARPARPPPGPRLWARPAHARHAAIGAPSPRRRRGRRDAVGRGNLRGDAQAAGRRGRSTLEALDDRVGANAGQRAGGASTPLAAREHRRGERRRGARHDAGGPRSAVAPRAAARHLRHRARGRHGDRRLGAGPRPARLRAAGTDGRDFGRARSGPAAHRRAERAEAGADRAGRGPRVATARPSGAGPRRGGGQGHSGIRRRHLDLAPGARARDDDAGAGPARRGNPQGHRGGRRARRRSVCRPQPRHHLRPPAQSGPSAHGPHRDRRPPLRSRQGLAVLARRADQGGGAASTLRAARRGALAFQGRPPPGAAGRSAA